MSMRKKLHKTITEIGFEPRQLVQADNLGLIIDKYRKEKEVLVVPAREVPKSYEDSPRLEGLNMDVMYMIYTR